VGKNLNVDTRLGDQEVYPDLFHLLSAISVQKPEAVFVDETWNIVCAGSKYAHGEDGLYNDTLIFDRYRFPPEGQSICLTPAQDLADNASKSIGIASFLF
jgi:hypothetical protein